MTPATTETVQTLTVRPCPLSNCTELGNLVEFHPAAGSGELTLRWKCPAGHAWEDHLSHSPTGPTVIETERAR
jgi:hypothetical protein